MGKLGRKRKKHKVLKGIEHKHCSCCKQWQALGKFHTSKYSWDGLHNLCKKCGNEKSKLSHRKNAQSINEKRRNRTTFDLSKIKSHDFSNGVECKICYKCKKEKTLSDFYKC